MTSHFIVVSDARFILEFNKLVTEPFVNLSERLVEQRDQIADQAKALNQVLDIPESLQGIAIGIVRDMVLCRGNRNVAVVDPWLKAEGWRWTIRNKFVDSLQLNYSNVFLIADDFARILKYHPSPELNFQLLLEMIDKHTTSFRFTDSMTSRREREAAKRAYLRGELLTAQDSVE